MPLISADSLPIQRTEAQLDPWHTWIPGTLGDTYLAHLDPWPE
jgi:hypothetical protein